MSLQFWSHTCCICWIICSDVVSLWKEPKLKCLFIRRDRKPASIIYSVNTVVTHLTGICKAPFSFNYAVQFENQGRHQRSLLQELWEHPLHHGHPPISIKHTVWTLHTTTLNIFHGWILFPHKRVLHVLFAVMKNRQAKIQRAIFICSIIADCWSLGVCMVILMPQEILPRFSLSSASSHTLKSAARRSFLWSFVNARRRTEIRSWSQRAIKKELYQIMSNFVLSAVFCACFERRFSETPTF